MGLALQNLITAHDWSARKLASEAGVAPSTISAYIWEDALTRERLEELADLMGLGPAYVERASSPPAWSCLRRLPHGHR